MKAFALGFVLASLGAAAAAVLQPRWWTNEGMSDDYDKGSARVVHVEFGEYLAEVWYGARA